MEIDGTGATLAVNTFGDNGLLSRHTGGTSVFYTFDPQGSVAQRLNSSGTVLSSHMFEAYGLEISPPSSEPFGFGAQWGNYTDRESGLVLMTHRYYDPALARFLTRDPSGYAAGLNLHRSSGNAPAGSLEPGEMADPCHLRKPEPHHRCMSRAIRRSLSRWGGPRFFRSPASLQDGVTMRRLSSAGGNGPRRCLRAENGTGRAPA